MDFLLSLLSHHEENVSHSPWGRPMRVECLPSVSITCLQFCKYFFCTFGMYSAEFLHAQNNMSASQLLTLHQKNVLGLLLG